MNASEDVKLPFVVIDAVAIPNIGNFSSICKPMVLVIIKAEHPGVIEPGRLILPTEEVHIGVVCRQPASEPWRWNVLIM